MRCSRFFCSIIQLRLLVARRSAQPAGHTVGCCVTTGTVTMRNEQEQFDPAARAPLVESAPDPLRSERSGRVHWVVVMTRALRPEDNAPANAILVTRFWHPRDHSWSENSFESLDHALRLFVDESGWVLRQQQALDTPHAHELIFEARREDFSRPSTEQMLQDVGLSAQDVQQLLRPPPPEKPS
jgi:hypothetical protein